jgi:D-alanyl-D-alanine carboxypeptidase
VANKLKKFTPSVFLIFLCLTFVYIATISKVFDLRLSILKAETKIKSNTLGVTTKEPFQEETKYPKLLGSETIDIDAKSAFAVDADSGVILYQKNYQEPVMPASTSKIITAMVAIDSYDLDQKLTVFNTDVEGQKIGLMRGEVLTARDLLYALLVSSANDAAEVLAQNYPGGRDLFVSSMNIKAHDLGLKSSLFVNPTGLDDNGQTTTAEDLVRASFYAMQDPIFEKVVATKKYVIVNDKGETTHTLYNINRLLGEVEGVRGIKTGKTDGAMENLITYIERGDAKVLIAVMGSSDRFNETKRLIEWIFANYDFN